MELESMATELDFYATWFNAARPHQGLGGETPNEVYFRCKPANKKPRFEPRAKWPRGSPCAAPQARIRGACGTSRELALKFESNRSHLPLIRLRRAA
jgi:hypothetical protein